MSSIIEKVAHIKDGAEILAGWLGDGATPASQEVAQSRTDICNSCNLNQQGNVFVASVAAAIKKTVEIKNGLGLTTNGSKKLGTCQLCSCPLKLKVFVPINVVRRGLAAQEFSDAPAHCWMVTEKLEP